MELALGCPYTPSHGDLHSKNVLIDGNGPVVLDLEYLDQRGQYADEPVPDIILLDPALPGHDGTDVLAALRDDPELSEIPVVVLTSSAVGEEIVRSSGLDADEYMQKPVEPDEFIEFVQSVEEFWLAIVREPAR